MILGIDASNIRTGGGATHLRCVLDVAEPERFGFHEVRVWTPSGTATQLAPRPWLKTIAPRALDRGGLSQVSWQLRQFPRDARDCDIVLVPGGSAPYAHPRLVAMSQNMLPFERAERARYGCSTTRARLAVLEHLQAATFRRAAGVIFLSDYAEREIRRQVREIRQSRVVSHGVEDRFRLEPRPVRPLAACSARDPMRLLYVSIVDVYKHQWHVAAAVSSLWRQGLPLRVRFVGPAYPPALKRLQRTLYDLDPQRQFAEYSGEVSYDALPQEWRSAEVAVFASSCENQPNVLIEAMASSMPIACADRGPMPELLGDAGLYFDPERADSIAAAIATLVADPVKRAALARRASDRARGFSWARCADETFAFLMDIARKKHR